MYFVCVDRYKNVVVYKVVNSIAWAVISKQKFGGVGGDNTARKTARKLGDLLLFTTCIHCIKSATGGLVG